MPSLIHAERLEQVISTHKWQGGEEEVHKRIQLRRDNPEQCWDIFTACIDNTDDIIEYTWRNFMEQFNEQEQQEIVHRYETLHVDELVLPEGIDVNSFLQLDGKTGIPCPKCKEFNVRYVLIANRSADEGMTADCSCRNELCLNRFRMRC